MQMIFPCFFHILIQKLKKTIIHMIMRCILLFTKISEKNQNEYE